MMLDRAGFPPSRSRQRNRFAHVVEELGSRGVGGDWKPGDTLPTEAPLGASHDDLLLQMGAVIGAGRVTNVRPSSRSYDVFVPLHRRGYEAIRHRRAGAARAAMERLLGETLAFPERDLADRPAPA